MKLFVYGGTFDPVTEGHVSVVKALVGRKEAVLVAPTAKNPWKEKGPVHSFEKRRKMWSNVLVHEGLSESERPSRGCVTISDQPYVYAWELVEKLDEGFEIVWVVGEDIENEVKNWAKWDEMGISYEVMPITVPVHATDVREGRVKVHPAIRDIYEKDS